MKRGRKKSDLAVMLEMNAELVRLGSDLARAIQDAKYPDGWGMSPHIKEALQNWNENLKTNYMILKQNQEEI